MTSNGAPTPDDRRVVLVVDDEGGVLRVFAKLLTNAGLRVLVATNALAAFDLLASEKIDVVVADYRLGRGPDGLELLATVERKWPRVGRVLMTALLDAGLALAAKSHHRVIPKDLSSDLISAIIVNEADRER